MEDAILKVTVRLYAGHKERVGQSKILLQLPKDASVRSLAEKMLVLFPDIAPNPENLVVAVNERYVDHIQKLQEGDEVALIPPVSGGFSIGN